MQGKGKASETAAAMTDAAATAASRNFEQTMAGLRNGADTATAGFETAQTRVKEGMDKAMKTAEEFVSLGQGNLEALVTSGQIWAAGVQDIQKQMAATAQSSFEESVATFKQLSSAKSLKDAVDLQAAFARSSVEKAVTDTGRLAESSVKLAEQAMAPITARMTQVVEKFTKTAA